MAWGVSWGTSWEDGAWEAGVGPVQEITDTSTLQLPVDYLLAGDARLILKRSEREGHSRVTGTKRTFGLGGSMGQKTSFKVTTSNRGY